MYCHFKYFASKWKPFRAGGSWLNPLVRVWGCTAERGGGIEVKWEESLRVTEGENTHPCPSRRWREGWSSSGGCRAGPRSRPPQTASPGSASSAGRADLQRNNASSLPPSPRQPRSPPSTRLPLPCWGECLLLNAGNESAVSQCAGLIRQWWVGREQGKLASDW